LLNEFTTLYDPDLNLSRRVDNRTRKEMSLTMWTREDVDVDLAEIKGLYNNIDAQFDPAYLSLLQEYYVYLLVQSHVSQVSQKDPPTRRTSQRKLEKDHKIEYEIAGANDVFYHGYEPRSFST
jgi:hypothetical protein